MLYLRAPTTDPYFNIAVEEYLLKSKREEFVYLYVNDPCIVVGKHQIALAEINPLFVRRFNLPVVRRISGGGTVYHDHGNINFSFIRNAEPGRQVDFRQYIGPVKQFLASLGLQAELNERNNLMISGFKVSGNAEHVYRNRVLHHGTLLFSVNQAVLNTVLRDNGRLYKGKSIPSVRSRTANIAGFLPWKQAPEAFLEALAGHLRGFFGIGEEMLLNQWDLLNIQELVKNKYNTWEWNFGYSPPYFFSNAIGLPDGEIKVMLEVEKGLIRTARFVSDCMDPLLISRMADALRGIPHEFNHVSVTLKGFASEKCFISTNPETFAVGFFE